MLFHLEVVVVFEDVVAVNDVVVVMFLTNDVVSGANTANRF